MTDLQAVEARQSRRSYLGPLPAHIVQKIDPLASQLADDYQLHLQLAADAPLLFGGFAHTYGMFKGVHSFLIVAGEKDDPHRYEKAGYAGQKLVLELTKLGFGSCWVSGTYNKKAVLKALPSGYELFAVIATGPVAIEPDRREKLLGAISFRGRKEGRNTVYDAPPPQWFYKGARAAEKAPSSLNQHPATFRYYKDEAFAVIPDETPRNFLDLGIAKLHFELAAGGRFELGNHALFHPDN